MLKKKQIILFIIFIFSTYGMLLSINLSQSALNQALDNEDKIYDLEYDIDDLENDVDDLEYDVDDLENDVDDLEWKIKWK